MCNNKHIQKSDTNGTMLQTTSPTTTKRHNHTKNRQTPIRLQSPQNLPKPKQPTHQHPHHHRKNRPKNQHANPKQHLLATLQQHHPNHNKHPHHHIHQHTHHRSNIPHRKTITKPQNNQHTKQHLWRRKNPKHHNSHQIHNHPRQHPRTHPNMVPNPHSTRPPTHLTRRQPTLCHHN